jgi:hypothetical protein
MGKLDHRGGWGGTEVGRSRSVAALAAEVTRRPAGRTSPRLGVWRRASSAPYNAGSVHHADGGSPGGRLRAGGVGR